jgi:GT2 family glycosyltransferase
MDFSVIIPSYNDGALLARCLQSLCRLDTDQRWELVVALDGSTDGSAALLRRGMGWPGADGGPLSTLVESGGWRALPLVLVELSTNRGRSAARNAALARARGKHRLFLDADLRVGPDWAEALLAMAQSSRCVVVGEMVYETDPAAPLDLALVEGQAAAEAARRSGLKAYQRYLETRGPWKYREGGAMPGRYFYTCNSCVPAQLLEKAGPFDERLRGWGGEDMDMGLRLEAAGAEMVYCRQARALHAQERSFSAHCANLERMGREALPLLVERHPALLDELQLTRLLPPHPQGVLEAAWRLGLHRLLVALDAMGLPLGERLYNLAVFLHYAGGFRQAAIHTQS